MTQVSTGGNHTCAFSSGGAAECVGAGNSGQLGNATSTDHWNAIASVGVSGLTKMVAGINFTCGFKSGTGQIYCWGSDSAGQQGNSTPTTDVTSPTALPGTDWVDVFAGYTHVCGKKQNGSVHCWGNNSHGQLGDGTTTNRNTPVLSSP